MPKLSSQKYVKLKTRHENGSANFRGTQNVKVTFAKAFVRKPRIVVPKGQIRGLSVNGFTLHLDSPSTEDVDYYAMPRGDGDDD